MFNTACHSRDHHVWARRALGVVIGLMALVGCKRVPSEQVIVPQAMSAIESRQQTNRREQTRERTIELKELCERACDNWLEHQFIVPVSYEEQDAETREVIDQVIDSQRLNNRDACIAECQRRSDRKRAQCIASGQSIMDIDDCRL